MTYIAIEPLTAAAFAPFGDVIETDGRDHFPINGGMTERFNDLTPIDLLGDTPRPMISIFRGQPYDLPLTLRLVERHPLGSQAFYPLSGRPFLVIAAPDTATGPGTPRAFLASATQGINFRANTWHGVLTALETQSDFLVIDRGGPGQNLEEHLFEIPYRITMPSSR